MKICVHALFWQINDEINGAKVNGVSINIHTPDN